MRAIVLFTAALLLGTAIGAFAATAPPIRIVIGDQQPLAASTASALRATNASGGAPAQDTARANATNASEEDANVTAPATADAGTSDEEDSKMEMAAAAEAEAAAMAAAEAAHAEADAATEQTTGLLPYTIGELADAFNKLNASREEDKYVDKEIQSAVDDGLALTQAMVAQGGAGAAPAATSAPPSAPATSATGAPAYLGLDAQAQSIEAQHAAILASIGAATIPPGSSSGGASPGSTLGKNKAAAGLAAGSGVEGDLGAQMSALDGEHAAMLAQVSE